MLQGTIIIYYDTLSRGVGFKIWMILEMESVHKLLHSHLPNQVIEPFPRTSSLLPSLPKIPTHHTLPSQTLLLNQISKFYSHLYEQPQYNSMYSLLIPLIPSVSFVNRFVNKSIQLRLKPLTEPLRAIYTTPYILVKNTTNIM